MPADLIRIGQCLSKIRKEYKGNIFSDATIVEGKSCDCRYITHDAAEASGRHQDCYASA